MRRKSKNSHWFKEAMFDFPLDRKFLFLFCPATMVNLACRVRTQGRTQGIQATAAFETTGTTHLLPLTMTRAVAAASAGVGKVEGAFGAGDS